MRQLPWKNERDPYKIWLSEIILQQTRAEQGLPYYQAFVQRYPTLGQLAAAADQEVFKLWEGLGYYSRCRNLLAAARQVVADFGGRFPDTHEQILSLKGVGTYTAAAIASFAFGLPHAVVDGNVIRVLARYFGVDTPFDTTTGRQQFAALAQQLLDSRQPAAYNQAIMDFGATVCTPRAPLCAACPMQSSCMARKHELTAQLPVRLKKQEKKPVHLVYLIIRFGKQTLVRQRSGKDIWRHLYEFLPAPADLSRRANPEACRKWLLKEHQLEAECLQRSRTYRQTLTHRQVSAVFLEFSAKTMKKIPGFEWVRPQQLADLAFPQIIRQYLSEHAPA